MKKKTTSVTDSGVVKRRIGGGEGRRRRPLVSSNSSALWAWLKTTENFSGVLSGRRRQALFCSEEGILQKMISGDGGRKRQNSQ